jgi:ParB family chromosome partitioning protein
LSEDIDRLDSNSLTIPIDSVHYRPDHIRKSFCSLASLKTTVSDAGLLQPILVSRESDGTYAVIDGARRLAALRELGVRDLIVGRDVVMDIEETEADVRFKQIIVNVQREDLNAIELGQAFVTLKEDYGYQYNEIADIIGKTSHFVAGKVGLIKRLDPEVRQDYLEDLPRGKCILNTFSPDPTVMPEAGPSQASDCGKDDAGDSAPCQPYLMNVNILEDIARLPREIQPTAYREIKARRMDKENALDYLRGMKNATEKAYQVARDEPIVITETVRLEQVHNIRRQIDKISRDLEGLMIYMRSGSVEPEITAEIESMIGQLSSLCNKMKAKEAEYQGKILAVPDTGL